MFARFLGKSVTVVLRTEVTAVLAVTALVLCVHSGTRNSLSMSGPGLTSRARNRAHDVSSGEILIVRRV